MKVVCVGGGDIATNGIVPVTGGVSLTGLDVRDIKSIEAAWLPGTDVVVNCAGISHPATVLDSVRWADEIDVNLIGSYNVARVALDYGVKTLVFLASVAGLSGKPNHSAYSASKAGVISLVQSLAHEGHDAYAISPGRVDSKMREKDYPGEDKRTRLDPLEVGAVVEQCLAGVYAPGSNVIIRKIGHDTHLKVDDGEPWKSWLRVGQPPVC